MRASRASITTSACSAVLTGASSSDGAPPFRSSCCISREGALSAAGSAPGICSTAHVRSSTSYDGSCNGTFAVGLSLCSSWEGKSSLSIGRAHLLLRNKDRVGRHLQAHGPIQDPIQVLCTTIRNNRHSPFAVHHAHLPDRRKG